MYDETKEYTHNVGAKIFKNANFRGLQTFVFISAV